MEIVSSQSLLNHLNKGVFLTVQFEQKINTMIIGWAQLGSLWNRTVLVIYVRYSRYTFELLEQAKEFTVSVPIQSELRQEITFCGQNSGRDVNKFEICHLTPIPGKSIRTPIIGECDIHYECKVIYKQKLEPNQIMDSINDRYYSDQDYHMVYYGEIINSYQNE